MDSSRGRTVAVTGALVAAVAALVVATTVSTSDPRTRTPQSSGVADSTFLAECQAALGYPARTPEDIDFLTRCVHALDPAGPTTQPTTPVPSGTTVPPTQQPTATPTVQPTTPAPTITPTSTPGPTLRNCMTSPHVCGYPDQTNTGVPAGQTLVRRNGDLTITQPGTYTNLDVTGCVDIQANNVIITKSRIGSAGNCPYYVIRSFGNRSGILISDTEIVLTGYETKGIAFNGYTALRVWFHGGSDCAHMGNNVTVRDSFCDVSVGGDGPHYDGFQSDGGRNLRIEHNTIKVPFAQTSAILMSTNTAPIRDVIITRNLVAGGGYTIYCGTGAGGVAANETFTDNRFSRIFFGPSSRGPGGGYWGPTTSCENVAVRSGNIWDDTLLPV